MVDLAALRIPVRADTSQFDQSINQVSSKLKAAPNKLTVDVKLTGVDDANAKLARINEMTRKGQEAILAQQAAMMRDWQLMQQTLAAQRTAVQHTTAANDNYAASGSRVADALLHATKTAIDYTASHVAMATTLTATAFVLQRVFRVLTPFVLAFKAVKEAVELATEAWRLGGEALDRYRKIAEKAAKVDLSVTYFQKITKAAENAKLPVDALTKALQALQASSADQLGGSTLQKRLDASIKAGNFAGNAGVVEFAQANTTEQKFRAIADLIHQAMEAGQRLAAIDIANTAFGAEAANNLRKDAEYFDKILASAEQIADKKIVAPEDVARAVELQNRYDAAVKILEDRWHPIQDLLTQAGIEFHANWVSTVETIAAGVDWAKKLVEKLGDVPSWFQNKINAGGQWFIDNTTTPESRKAAEASFGINSDPSVMSRAAIDYADAVKRLRAGLQNQYEMQRKVNEANTIAQKTMGDTSHAIDDVKKAQQAAANAFERAQEDVAKHTARMQADTEAIGHGVGALEELRAKAQLLAAAKSAGVTVTAALSGKIQELARSAGEAAQKLAESKAASDVYFQLQTAGLSGVEAQIAQLNRRLHGDDWQQYGNTATAQIMRIADAQERLNEAIKGFGSDLVSSLQQGKSLFASLENAAGNLVNKLASSGLDKLFSGNGFNFDLSKLASGIGKGVAQSLDDIALKHSVAAANPSNSFAFNGISGNTAMMGLGAAAIGLGTYGQGRQIGASGGSTGSGALSGALSGAMAGAAIGGGPVGMLVGGVAGGRAGLFGDGQKRRDGEDKQKESEDDSIEHRRAA